MEADRRLKLLIGVLAVLIALILGSAPAQAADPVIAAAGDIACTNSSSDCPATPRGHQMQTSDLLMTGEYSRVLVLGDNQYNSGSLSDYQTYYDPSWGRVKSITLPAPGNHDRCPESGYDNYFGYPCWYSRDIGAWRIISLDSDNPTDTAQLSFLDSALQFPGCTLVFWHHGRFSSGHDGDNTFVQPFWERAYNARADIVLSGHSHNYERFAPMDAAGNLDNANGVREFIVGTGGAFFTGVSSARPNSQVRQNNTFGILKLTLHSASYSWQFVPEAGRTFTDSGSDNCHKSTGGGPDTQAPSVPQNLTANSPNPFQVNLSWNASTDNVGVTGYEIYRNGSLLTTRTTTSFTDATVMPGQAYSYQVRARDAAGNRSAFSNTATTTTPVPDTTAPTVPANLAASATGPFNVNLSWNPSTDNVGVTGYEIYRGGVLLATKNGSTTTHSDTTVRPGQTYSYQVRALDAAGNRSAFSAPATASPVDTQPPGAPANLAANATSSSQVNLTWTAASDDVGVAGYLVYRNGGFLASAAGTSFADTSVSFAVTNSYQVAAVDDAGNRSGFSNTAPVVLTTKASPDADAQVVQASPGTNYGTGSSSFLRTDGGSDPDIESYLRFTLAGVSGPVQSAKLRVHAYSGTSDGPAVYASATDWSESAINWNNRPAVTSGAIDDRGAISSGSWVEYNVAPLVPGDGSYGFRLAQASTDGVDFRPREHSDSTLRPQLVVTTIQAAPPPPPPPPPGPGPGPSPGPGGQPGSPLNPGGPFSSIGGSDRLAPKLTLGGAKVQRLKRGAVVVTARCDERCTISAGAKLEIGRASGLFKSSKATQAVAAGKDAKLRLKFSGRSLRLIRRALARGRRVLAKVTVRANDAAGNSGSVRATIRLKR